MNILVVNAGSSSIKYQFIDIIEEQFKEDFDKRNYVVSNEKLEKTGWFCVSFVCVVNQNCVQTFR